MGASAPMDFGMKKAGTANVLRFVKRKKKVISALEKNKSADATFKAATAGLTSIPEAARIFIRT